MKKIMCLAFAVAALAAVAEYSFLEVRGATRGNAAKVEAFDVQSTNATQTASLKRIRDIVAYSNALDIATHTVTNAVYFPQTIVTNGVTNIVQGVSNVVKTVTTTNGYKKVVSKRNCVTNTLVSVTCVGGFACTNVNDWVLRDDALFVDCADTSAKTTVIFSK